MAYGQREPDFQFSIPTGRWDVEPPEIIGMKIDAYLSSCGVLLSSRGVISYLKSPFGGEATYHVGNNTVLVRGTPRSSPYRYDVELFVEGSDKAGLVKDLAGQLAGFSIPENNPPGELVKFDSL